MSPMSPPPPSPQDHAQFPQLIIQSEMRREALALHKATVKEFSAKLEETLGDSSTATSLPTRAHLNAAAKLEESSDDDGLATTVLRSECAARCECDVSDPIADGFAALRVQRVQRKAALRELKRTAANVNYAQQQTKYIPPHAAAKLRAEFNAKDAESV